MEWTFQNVLTQAPITGVTINTVMLNPAMRDILYAVIGISFVIGLAYFFNAERSFRQAVKKSVLASFFASGLLYAVHADIGWMTWTIQDSRTFSGKTTDEKLLALEGPYYAFARSAKRVLTDAYTLYTPDPNMYAGLRCQYYFLPARKRERANIIVVLGDQQARYDLKQRTFTRGDVRYTNVEPLLMYLPDAYVVKVQ